MGSYLSRRCIIDPVNHYTINNNTYVQTDDDLWVKRFGSSLKPVASIPEAAVPVVVENTVEGKSEEEVKTSSVEEKPKAKLQTKKSTKVVDEASDK